MCDSPAAACPACCTATAPPPRFDAHFFSNVWHDWNEEQCANLAARSFKALPSGGRILLHEMLMAVRVMVVQTLPLLPVHVRARALCAGGQGRPPPHRLLQHAHVRVHEGEAVHILRPAVHSRCCGLRGCARHSVAQQVQCGCRGEAVRGFGSAVVPGAPGGTVCVKPQLFVCGANGRIRWRPHAGTCNRGLT